MREDVQNLEIAWPHGFQRSLIGTRTRTVPIVYVIIAMLKNADYMGKPYRSMHPVI